MSLTEVRSRVQHECESATGLGAGPSRICLRPVLVDAQDGPMTGNGCGPMPLAKPGLGGPFSLANDIGLLSS
jgi:hypothetical protein